MSPFWENATQLMEAAVAASDAGLPTNGSLTVLIGPGGGIQILTHNDWPLDRIAEERGSQRAYRVTRSNGRVAINGREGVTTCWLESEASNVTARRLLRDEPRYLLD